MYISTRRAHNEDTVQRQQDRQKAEYLENKRGMFIDWMRNNGYSREQMQQEVARMDEMIDFHRHASDQSQIDKTAEDA